MFSWFPKFDIILNMRFWYPLDLLITFEIVFVSIYIGVLVPYKCSPFDKPLNLNTKSGWPPRMWTREKCASCKLWLSDAINFRHALTNHIRYKLFQYKISNLMMQELRNNKRKQKLIDSLRKFTGLSINFVRFY